MCQNVIFSLGGYNLDLEYYRDNDFWSILQTTFFCYWSWMQRGFLTLISTPVAGTVALLIRSSAFVKVCRSAFQPLYICEVTTWCERCSFSKIIMLSGWLYTAYSVTMLLDSRLIYCVYVTLTGSIRIYNIFWFLCNIIFHCSCEACGPIGILANFFLLTLSNDIARQMY